MTTNMDANTTEPASMLYDYAVIVRPNGAVNAYSLAEYESYSKADRIGEFVSMRVIKQVPNVGAAIWNAAKKDLVGLDGEAMITSGEVAMILEKWLEDQDWCISEESAGVAERLATFCVELGGRSPLEGTIKLYREDIAEVMWVTKSDYDRNPAQWGEDWVNWEDWVSQQQPTPTNPDQLALEGV